MLKCSQKFANTVNMGNIDNTINTGIFSACGSGKNIRTVAGNSDKIRLCEDL